jgi:hypothetical protein
VPITVTIEESTEIVEVVNTPIEVEIRPGFVTVTNTEVDKIYTAGGTISVASAVYLNSSGEVVQADADNAATRNIIGIAITAATATNPCTVRTFGTFSHVSYSFTAGDAIYVGSGGTLVATPNGTAYVAFIGAADAADSVFVNVHQSINLV